MKRVLFLVLSNNDPQTTANEEAIRQTWATEVSKFNNASLYFIKEAPEHAICDFINNDYIYIAQSEGIMKTYSKMFRAFIQVLVNLPDFDYLVRINTSTWCNVAGVMNFIEQIDNYNLGHIRCFPTALIAHIDNKYDEPLQEKPYWLGNAFILPKQSVKDIVSYGWPAFSALGVDDMFCSYIVSRNLAIKFGDYFNFYATVGIEFSQFEDDPECSNITSKTFKSCLFIQIKNFFKSKEKYEVTQNRDNEPYKMKTIHNRFLECQYAPHMISTAIFQTRLNKDCLICTDEILSKIYGENVPQLPYGWHTFKEAKCSLPDMLNKYPAVHTINILNIAGQ